MLIKQNTQTTLWSSSKKKETQLTNDCSSRKADKSLGLSLGMFDMSE